MPASNDTMLGLKLGLSPVAHQRQQRGVHRACHVSCPLFPPRSPCPPDNDAIAHLLLAMGAWRDAHGDATGAVLQQGRGPRRSAIGAAAQHGGTKHPSLQLLKRC